MPAVEWLLKKYEENLDLRTATGKRKYSDVALRLIGYLKDEVERASYEEKVAEKLGVEVEVLREKGERLNKKFIQAEQRKIRKKAKTELVSDGLRKMEDSLLSLKIFGGVVKCKIPLEIPEEEARIDELEMVFNREHEAVGVTSEELEREAEMLLDRYEKEKRKIEIEKLNAELAELDEDDERYEEIVKQIWNLQNPVN